MKRVSGFLHETKPLQPGDEETVMRIYKGDILLFKGQYVQCEGFYRNEASGKLQMRLGFFEKGVHEKVRAWARRNPHQIKRLESGYLIPKGGT